MFLDLRRLHHRQPFGGSFRHIANRGVLGLKSQSDNGLLTCIIREGADFGFGAA
jgi:hypothetical protein